MSTNKYALKYSSRFAATGAFVAFVVFFLFALRGPSHLYIEMANDNGGAGQVYVGTENGYEAEKHIPFSLMPDGKIHSYGIDIRTSIPNSLRIAPGAAPGNIKIDNIRLESPLFNQNYSCEQLRLLHALKPAHTENSKCEFTAIAVDPYFDVKIFSSLSLKYTHIKWQVITEGFMYAGIIFLLISLAIRLRDHVTTTEENWLTNLRCKRLYIFLAFGFISFVFLKLHVSSIDEWKNYVSTNIRSGVIVGHPRPIRSDEWVVSTPFYASQVANNFPLNNPSLGAENVTLAATVPVQGVYGYTQPRFWGFYLMNFERGFSWLYGWRVFGLFLAIFSLFTILTKGAFGLSLIGSAWIVFSPFIQWWFGTNLPDMVIGFAGGVTSLYLLLLAKSLRTIILLSLTLFFAGTSFVSALYPAFLLPLFYLAIFLVGGLLVRDRLVPALVYKWRHKLLFLALSIGGILLILALWQNQTRAIIELIQNSSYPGKRIALGGDMSFSSLALSLFGSFLRIDKFPIAFGNVCEASNFLLLFPLAWITMLRSNQRFLLRDPLAISISIYILLMLIWMFVGYSEWIAAFTKMSMSPPSRSLLGLGLASIFLTIYVFANQNVSAPTLKFDTININRWVSIFLLSAGSFYLAAMLRNNYPDFVTWSRIALILPVITLWFVFYFFGMKRCLVTTTLVLILPGVAVNPLAQGVNSLKNSELSSVLMEDKSIGPTKWLVSNTIFHPQYFKGNGATVWNGVRFISDPAEMAILDPEGHYRDVWNRYAHFVVTPLPSGYPTEFELMQADVVKLKIDFCSTAIGTLGINRFAFSEKPDISYIACLDPIRLGPVAGTWLYKKKIHGV